MEPVSFWIHWDGAWVGVYFDHMGDVREFSTSRRTDEGWSSVYERYELTTDDDGAPVVLCTVDTDGRDCDGRLSTHWEGSCSIADLVAVPRDDNGPARPRWVRKGSSQRDYSAEAAGY